MCVYNGALYLREQLESIAAQTELPSRMVIVDDGSNDGSWELLQHWAASADFPVTLERNDQNLGVIRNFEKAVRMLLDDVDLVFFSDQDDVWFPGKLAAFVEVFAADAGVGLVHSDAELIDLQGRSMNARLFAALLVTEKELAELEAGGAYRVYVKRNLVTGAACACRSEVLARALPFSDRWIHDEWIALTAALTSRVRLLPEPWMAYRLHGRNTVGLPVPNLIWRVGSAVKSVIEPQAPRQQRRAERLEELRRHAEQVGAPEHVLTYLDVAVAHARHRATLPRHFLRRAAAVGAEWRHGHYQSWSSGALSMLHDLLIAT